MIIFRNIVDLIKSLDQKDTKLHEAFMRLNDNASKLTELLNNPVFDKVILRELEFVGDQNLLNSLSALTQCCRLGHSANQNVLTAVPFTLTFDTKYFDTDKMYNTTSPTRITFNTTGRYIVGIGATWAASVAGYRSIQIVRNGAVTIAISLIQTVTEVGLTTAQNISTLCNFARGDYIEVVATQNSGGTVRISPLTEHSPIFWAHREG